MCHGSTRPEGEGSREIKKKDGMGEWGNGLCIGRKFLKVIRYAAFYGNVFKNSKLIL